MKTSEEYEAIRYSKNPALTYARERNGTYIHWLKKQYRRSRPRRTRRHYPTWNEFVKRWERKGITTIIECEGEENNET